MKIRAVQRELRMSWVAQRCKFGEVRGVEVGSQPLTPAAAENCLEHIGLISGRQRRDALDHAGVRGDVMQLRAPQESHEATYVGKCAFVEAVAVAVVATHRL